MAQLTFEYSNPDGSGKFWEIDHKNNVIITRFGRIGNNGSISQIVLDNDLEALKSAQTKIKEKLKKGYKYIKGKGSSIDDYFNKDNSTKNINKENIRYNLRSSTRNCNMGYICPDDKQCNTKSGRCINKTSKIFKELEATKSVSKNKTKKNCNQEYICPEDKICNTKTGRCINKSKKNLIKTTVKTSINKKTIKNNSASKVVFTGNPMLADKFYDSNEDMEFKSNNNKKVKKNHFIYNGDSGSRIGDKWNFTQEKTLYKCDPTGWYISEKYDGVRAVWNGRDFISRGNKVYHAPEWFKELMPPGRALDGELHTGKGTFQDVTGITRHIIPNDKDWAKVIFQVFDIPEKDLVNKPFSERLPILSDVVNESCKKWKDIKLPAECKKSKECPLQLVEQILVKNMDHAYQIYKDAILAGAEGTMLRPTNSLYEYKRSKHLLKWKPVLDAEALVIGFNEGSNKLSGYLGTFKVALIDDKTKKVNKSKIFNLSGRLTEDFRKKYTFVDGKISKIPKGDKYPNINDSVSFTFMEYTNDGIPRQPIFQRIRKEL